MENIYLSFSIRLNEIQDAPPELKIKLVIWIL
jgi:hypothetical protein